MTYVSRYADMPLREKSFIELDLLIDDYLNALEAGVQPEIPFSIEVTSDRSEFPHHASDIFKCHRQVAFRELRAKKNVLPPQHEAVRHKRFVAGHWQHNLIYNTFAYHGLLWNCEVPVNGLPDGWGGTLDLIVLYRGEYRILDVKSVHPNSMKYQDSFPKWHNVGQVVGYQKHYTYPGTTVPIITSDPGIIYIDRGGDNQTFVCIVDDWLRVAAQVEQEMLVFEGEFELLPHDLPALLPRRLVAKSYGREVYQEADWGCSDLYCDYCGNTCQPDTSSNKMAYKKEGRWLFTRAVKNDPDLQHQVIAFIEEEAKKRVK